jgi:hypothetical protein
MSSISLATARARRSGNNAPPISGNRPVTSIGSQAAFAQQMPSGMGYNMPPPSSNVRIAKSLQSQQQGKQQSSQSQQYQQFYEQQQSQQSSQSQQQSQNGLPFQKLSISDAIGLITLRLGRVEQWVIDTDHENEEGNTTTNGSGIPHNHQIIDNSVLTSIINRLDSLEKNNNLNIHPSEDLTKLNEDIKILNEQFTRMGDVVSKHTIELAKCNEQVFKFNREFTETKDILKSFMVKYDMFSQEIIQNFKDYETALVDLENRIPKENVNDRENVNDSENVNNSENVNDSENVNNSENVNDSENVSENMNNTLSSLDLKNMIKQELLNN